MAEPHAPASSPEDKDAARDRLIAIVRDRGHLELDEAVQLASGDWSRHFVDAKRALADGQAAALAARTLIGIAEEHGIRFDAVGGLTMGADVLAHGIAILRPHTEWFVVRKQAKERGTRRRIEGAELGAGRRVLLVEDVVTRGSSIADALTAIRSTGAEVVAAATLVDRGEHGRQVFEAARIPYMAVITYEDLGIPPVGSE